MSTLSENEFTGIFDLYYEDVCRFLSYYTLDRYVIEEVAQDVFVKLWQEREIREVRHIKTYLLKSARNRVLNLIRDERNHDEILSAWAKNEVRRKSERDCIDREHFMKVLYCAIDLLPDKCKETFLLRHEENLSYQEISQRQNVSVRTVESQIRIALQRVKEYILSHPLRSLLY